MVPTYWRSPDSCLLLPLHHLLPTTVRLLSLVQDPLEARLAGHNDVHRHGVQKVRLWCLRVKIIVKNFAFLSMIS